MRKVSIKKPSGGAECLSWLVDKVIADESSPARLTSRSRHATMRRGLDIGSLRGLEIGALADPIVHKGEGEVRYVDFADGDELRERYADVPGVDIAAIVEVDALWGAQSLSACIGGGQVDYVMASHVAEHVADLVTWLAEVRAVLAPGGELRLALPDARFSHDVLRAHTRLLDLLVAWVLRVRRPQVRDVLDFRLHVAPEADARTLYDGTADRAAIKPQHSFSIAVEAAGWARDLPEHYFDVHCWVVSPKGFARLMQELAEHGLLQLACAGMVDTAPPIWEFYAFMTPCDDPLTVTNSWRDVQATLHDPLPGSGAAREAARQVQEDAAQRVALAQAEQATRGLAEALAAIKDRIGAMEGSLSWRITAPLRRVRALWRPGLRQV